MKRIIEGVTYNTETSTVIAKAEYETGGGSGEIIETLYQTRGGAFFVHQKTTTSVWSERDQTYTAKTKNEFIPMSAERAQEWLITGDAEVYSNPFGDPPEASAMDAPNVVAIRDTGATIYMRVPTSLKRRVDDAAKDQGLSGNVWAMRCVEKCLERQDGPSRDERFRLWAIWAISSNIARLGGDYDEARMREGFDTICTLIEEHVSETYDEVDALASWALDESAKHDDICKRFDPHPQG